MLVFVELKQSIHLRLEQEIIDYAGSSESLRERTPSTRQMNNRKHLVSAKFEKKMRFIGCNPI